MSNNSVGEERQTQATIHSQRGREPTLRAVHGGQQHLGRGSAHRASTAMRVKTNLEYHQVGLLKLLLLLDDVAAQRPLLVGLVGFHTVVEEAGVGEAAWGSRTKAPAQTDVHGPPIPQSLRPGRPPAAQVTET